MVTVFYYHVDTFKEHYKEFEDVHEALRYYTKVKNIKDKNKRRMYIMSYVCQTDYELKVMERIYK